MDWTSMISKMSCMMELMQLKIFHSYLLLDGQWMKFLNLSGKTHIFDVKKLPASSLCSTILWGWCLKVLSYCSCDAWLWCWKIWFCFALNFFDLFFRFSVSWNFFSYIAVKSMCPGDKLLRLREVVNEVVAVEVKA